MKKLLIFLICCCFVSCQNKSEKKESVKKTEKQKYLDIINLKNIKATSNRLDYLYKLHINKKDSIIYWPGICCDTYRVFGYENSDLRSKKVILISVFKDDVDGNPFGLKYGAYNDISERNEFEIKYIGNDKKFIKAKYIKLKKIQGIIYFEKKWAQFDEEE